MVKDKLGKVVGTVNGYKVRVMLKTVQKVDVDRFGRRKVLESNMLPSGKFGIYAGKNLCREGFKTKDEALAFAKEY